MAILNIGVGSAANDGTGDSIRDAFIKTNDNFNYLDVLTQNLITGNLTAEGNIRLDAVDPSYWTGTIYLNGDELATVNNLFGGGTVGGQTFFTATDQSSSTTTGAVTITGGLGVAKNAYIGNIFTYSLSATTAIGAASLNSTTATFTGMTRTGDLEVTGSGTMTGNVFVGNASALSTNNTKRNVAAYFGYFQEVNGTLQTAAQPNVTSLGILTLLSTTGNVTSANLTTGNITASGNLFANNVGITTNLTAGWGRIAGNLYSQNINSGVGTFANATVQSYPSNYHVVPKGYVNSVAVAFAVALGS